MADDILIRETTLDDLPSISEIGNTVYPYMVRSLAARRQAILTVPERARERSLVAELAGRVVGSATASLSIFTTAEDSGHLSLTVHPDHRGRGVGSALFAACEAHLRTLGLRRVRAWCPDEPESLGWARARGFEPSRPVRYSVADPTALPPMPAVPDGVRLATLAEAGVEVVYEIDSVAFLDEPGDLPPSQLPLAEWTRIHWDNPDQRHELGVVAFVDGAPAGTTFVEADLATGRSWSGGTAVLREYRGRGLAKLMKSESLRRAASAGVTAAYTANDEQNAPMLAVNEWLGYRVTATQWSCIREF